MMTVTSTLPEQVVATAIQLERQLVREAFGGVYRLDGSVDVAALARFAARIGVIAPETGEA